MGQIARGRCRRGVHTGLAGCAEAHPQAFRDGLDQRNAPQHVHGRERADGTWIQDSQRRDVAQTNPPTNLSCRYFTHSAEFIIWARREAKTPHFFDYDLMRELAGGQQMRDVWQLPAIAPWEKKFGKHPTQKPLSLLVRILLASTREGQWILDPFAGSCTTGIAAHLLERRFFGIDLSSDFLSLGVSRFREACTPAFQAEAWRRIADLRNLPGAVSALEPDVFYNDLPPFLEKNYP